MTKKRDYDTWIGLTDHLVVQAKRDLRICNGRQLYLTSKHAGGLLLLIMNI